MCVSKRRAALLLLLAIGCQDTPATAVVSAMAADSPTLDRVTHFRLLAQRGDATKYDEVFPHDAFVHPASLTFRDASDGDDRRPLRVRFEGYKGDPQQGGKLVISNSARLVFVKEKTKLLRLGLSRECLDKTCASADLTCRRGTCVPEQIDDPETELPDATSGDDEDTLDPGKFDDLTPVGGAAGAAGIGGAAGVAGIGGAAGVAGLGGAAGVAGIGGVAGVAGAAGIGGVSGVAGVAGAAGVAGVSGSSGLGGLAGEAGVAGIAGEAGAAGVAGAGAGGVLGGAGMGGIAGEGGAGMGGIAGSSMGGIAGSSMSGMGGIGATGGAGAGGASGGTGASGMGPVGTGTGGAGTGGVGGTGSLMGGGISPTGGGGAGSPQGGSGGVAGNVGGASSQGGLGGSLNISGFPNIAGNNQAGFVNNTSTIQSVALGEQHICALQTKGVTCWGANDVGQLGLDDTTSRGDTADHPLKALSPLALGGVPVAITASGHHTCAQLQGSSQDTLRCWGENYQGQLGLGDTSNRGTGSPPMSALPAVDVGPAAWSRVHAGTFNTCVERPSLAQLSCWGNNFRGQLGLGQSGENIGDGSGEMGVQLGSMSLGTQGETVAEMHFARQFACALLGPARVVKCWGANEFGQLGLGDANHRGDGSDEMGDSLPALSLAASAPTTGLRHVATGDEHACAILADGLVKCWGHNLVGQLGLGDTTTRGDQSGEMGTALPSVALGTGLTAVQIVAGAYHTCVLLSDGRVKCWGSNGYGQLGLGDTSRRGDGPGEMGDALPSTELGAGVVVDTLYAGGNSTCALTTTGRLKCWGANESGQLGLGDTQNRGDDPGEMGDSLPFVPLGLTMEVADKPSLP